MIELRILHTAIQYLKLFMEEKAFENEGTQRIIYDKH